MNAPHPRACRATLKVGCHELAIWALLSETTNTGDRRSEVGGKAWLDDWSLPGLDFDEVVELIFPDGRIESVHIIERHITAFSSIDAKDQVQLRFLSTRNMRT